MTTYHKYELVILSGDKYYICERCKSRIKMNCNERSIPLSFWTEDCDEIVIESVMES